MHDLNTGITSVSFEQKKDKNINLPLASLARFLINSTSENDPRLTGKLHCI